MESARFVRLGELLDPQTLKQYGIAVSEEDGRIVLLGHDDEIRIYVEGRSVRIIYYEGLECGGWATRPIEFIEENKDMPVIEIVGYDDGDAIWLTTEEFKKKVLTVYSCEY